jgi:hypothetical protein
VVGEGRESHAGQRAAPPVFAPLVGAVTGRSHPLFAEIECVANCFLFVVIEIPNDRLGNNLRGLHSPERMFGQDPPIYGLAQHGAQRCDIAVHGRPCESPPEPFTPPLLYRPLVNSLEFPSGQAGETLLKTRGVRAGGTQVSAYGRKVFGLYKAAERMFRLLP